MRFFMFPMIVVLTLSGCDKQQLQEETRSPATPPPVAMDAPPPSSQAPAASPQQSIVPQEDLPLPQAPPVAVLSEPTSVPAAPTPSQPTVASAPPDALTLAKQSGCLACHNVDTKIVGPAWKDVSARYKNDKEAKAKLIAKIKAGGKGNWTEVTGGMAMPPYSPRVSDNDIEILVDFVLSLAH